MAGFLLPAARLAEKLGLDSVVVPTGAGVGSAIGFLRAPIAYEVVRSRYLRLSHFDADLVNATMDEMAEEAYAIVRPAAGGEALVERREAFMRYLGQGHEIAVPVPLRALSAADGPHLQEAFDACYTGLYGRTIPDQDVEVLSWTLTVATQVPDPEPAGMPAAPAAPPVAAKETQLFDAETTAHQAVPVYQRDSLVPGARVAGPALIVEDQTTTVVTGTFDAAINELGYIVLSRRTSRD